MTEATPSISLLFSFPLRHVSWPSCLLRAFLPARLLIGGLSSLKDVLNLIHFRKIDRSLE